jgi:hypothetical protein
MVLQRRVLIAATVLAGTLSLAACEPQGTVDDGPGVTDPIPGEPGDPQDDLPADTGEQDL